MILLAARRAALLCNYRTFLSGLSEPTVLQENLRGVSSMGDDLVVKKLLMSSVVGEFSNLIEFEVSY